MATTYEPIATYTSTGTVNTYTFSSIPQTYTDLILVISSKVASGASTQAYTRVNGDTGNNYSYTIVYSAPGSGRNANLGAWACEDITTTEFNTVIYHFNNYSNTSTYKSAVAQFSSLPYVVAFAGLWRNTNAINSITSLTASGANYASGSTFTLYGIKAA